MRRQSPGHRQLRRVGRAHHVADMPLHRPFLTAAQHLGRKPLLGLQITLEVERAGVARPCKHVDGFIRPLADHRQDGIGADIWVHCHGVHFPRIKDAGSPGALRVADVADLGVEDNRYLVGDVGNRPLQRHEPGSAPLHVEAHVRLVGADQVHRGFDDALVERQHRIVPLHRRQRQPRRVRVQPHTEPGVVAFLRRPQLLQIGRHQSPSVTIRTPSIPASRWPATLQ